MVTVVGLPIIMAVSKIYAVSMKYVGHLLLWCNCCLVMFGLELCILLFCEICTNCDSIVVNGGGDGGARAEEMSC